MPQSDLAFMSTRPYYCPYCRLCDKPVESTEDGDRNMKYTGPFKDMRKLFYYHVLGEHPIEYMTDRAQHELFFYRTGRFWQRKREEKIREREPEREDRPDSAAQQHASCSSSNNNRLELAANSPEGEDDLPRIPAGGAAGTAQPNPASRPLLQIPLKRPSQAGPSRSAALEHTSPKRPRTLQPEAGQSQSGLNDSAGSRAERTESLDDRIGQMQHIQRAVNNSADSELLPSPMADHPSAVLPPPPPPPSVLTAPLPPHPQPSYAYHPQQHQAPHQPVMYAQQQFTYTHTQQMVVQQPYMYQQPGQPQPLLNVNQMASYGPPQPIRDEATGQPVSWPIPNLPGLTERHHQATICTIYLKEGRCSVSCSKEHPYCRSAYEGLDHCNNPSCFFKHIRDPCKCILCKRKRDQKSSKGWFASSGN